MPLLLEQGGPTKLEAPTDKVIYRAKHSSSKVQLKNSFNHSFIKTKSTKWLKARLNIFSKSHSQWSHHRKCISLQSWAISSTVFMPRQLFAPKPNPVRVFVAERWSRGHMPRQPCIYPRVCLFVKKSAHLYLVFAPVTPLVSHWNGNCDSLELETLVSCTSLANSGEPSGHSSSSRLKIVLSPPGAIS